MKLDCSRGRIVVAIIRPANGQLIALTGDAEVILKARALLDSKPEHAAVEIWEGTRLVARLNRNPTDESSQQVNVIRVVTQKDD